MKTMIAGRMTEVSQARMLEILIAESRVLVCRDLVRLKGQVGQGAAALRAELEDELQHLDELAGEQRRAVFS